MGPGEAVAAAGSVEMELVPVQAAAQAEVGSAAVEEKWGLSPGEADHQARHQPLRRALVKRRAATPIPSLPHIPWKNYPLAAGPEKLGVPLSTEKEARRAIF